MDFLVGKGFGILFLFYLYNNIFWYNQYYSIVIALFALMFFNLVAVFGYNLLLWFLWYD